MTPKKPNPGRQSRRQRALHAALIPCAAAVFALAGCGGDDPASPALPAAHVLSLDGSGDRVQDLGPASAFDFVSRTVTFTVEAWVRFDNPDADRLQIIAANTFTRDEGGFLFGLENRDSDKPRQLRLDVMDGSGEYAVSARSYPGVIVDTGWHHVCVTVNSAEARFYVDGIACTESSSWNFDLQLVPASRPLLLGDGYSESPTAYDFYLHGALDEVRIWTSYRTPAQIVEGMETAPGPDVTGSIDSGLVGYWRFDRTEDLGVGESGVNDVRDESAAGNHGELSGDAAIRGIDKPVGP